MANTTQDLENYFITTDEDGDWTVIRLADTDRLGTFETREEAIQAAVEDRAETEARAREEADDNRRSELRAEIAELLENVSRLDSLEGLLKSVKRLQD
jgi:predicted nucleotide-binding protein (sugar kinase/HSP70/actin superfamily)